MGEGVSLSELEAEIEEKIRARPIAAVDRVLEAMRQSAVLPESSESLCRLRGLFDRAVLALVNAKSPKLAPIEDPFDNRLDAQMQRLVAICLVRLLGVASECFENDPTLKRKALTLFDRALASDVYKAVKIETKMQTFEKIPALQPLAEQVESSLSTIIASTTGTTQLGTFRNRFMQELHRDLTKALVWPFVPRELCEKARIGELFGALEEYLGTSGAKQLSAYERARETLEKYRSEAEQYGTTYSCRFLAGVAQKLLILASDHIHESGVDEPARLEIVPTEKKYPFHTVNQIIDVRLQARNSGRGYAFSTKLTVLPSSEKVEIQRSQLYLGDLVPGALLTLEIPTVLSAPQKDVSLLAELNWVNYDSKPSSLIFELRLLGQRSDIDWDEVARQEPYSLEPVETKADFVGREEIVNLLLRLTQAKKVTSAYVYGQKRVGKTSIVKVLADSLVRTQPESFAVMYVHGGDYVHPDPLTTIEQLGQRICRDIVRASRSFEGIEIPEFHGALSPLAEFLDAISHIAPLRRFIFILDEFDELPVDLYKRGPVGDAFFLTLRAISGKGPFGFILVGGENMSNIMTFQGDRLNKFRAVRVDYFDREQHWPDFEALIRRPVSPWLEISEQALTLLYQESAGNPYFAKLIASEVFSLAVSRRDCHVTASEVQEAVRNALQHVSANSFEHFWRDGILATGAQAELVSVQRRRVLLALANAFRQKDRVQLEDIRNQPYVAHMDDHSLLRELGDFERRQIVLRQDSHYDIKVGLFKKWLVSSGVRELITSFGDLDEILKRKQQEEKAFVRSEEIVAVCQTWGLYRGRKISEDHVRTWLRQFGDNLAQRLMFKILVGLRFYTADKIRAKLKEAYGIVSRGLTTRLENGRRRRGDILVSYLDRVGKSGALYARLFADENEIYVDNVIERDKLAGAFKGRSDLQAVVFVDDFLGTGQSAAEYFAQLDEECGELIRKSGLRFYFVAVCGFQSAEARIQQALDKMGLPVSVHVCDLLDDKDKCFDEHSRLFPETTERNYAMNMAYEKGAMLEKRNPLGFGDCQATVVFEHGCPNNSLPILWAESKDWCPLFPRS
jgi:hypothetical protein